jgi:hydroxymethylbilane synthase
VSFTDKRVYRAGTRESALALAQTDLLIRRIQESSNVELLARPMKTSGDLLTDRSLASIGGKGLFTRELDRALLEGSIDLAVHSLKDMPCHLPDGLAIAAFSKREDPRDVLVLPITGPSPEKPIGCSSKRRALQLARLFPGWKTAPVRGNVLSRLEKLDRGEYGALVLAAAGLKRLGLARRISRFFEADEMLPAPGQGILCVVIRAEDDFPFLRAAADPDSACCALAERALVEALGGGCASAIGAYAEVDGRRLTLRGLSFETPGVTPLQGSVRGEKTEAEALGRHLARQLR